MRQKQFILLLIIIFSIFTGCADPFSPNKNDQAGDILFVLEANAQTVSKVNLDSGAVSLNFTTAQDIPADIEVDGEQLLILNSTPPSLTVVDANTGNLIKAVTLPRSSNPYQMIATGKAIYFTGWSSNKLYKIDDTDFTISDSIEVGINPQGLTYNGNYLFVANSGGFPDYAASSVSVINREDFSIAKTIHVSINPQNFAWAPDGKLHLVCTGNYADISGRVDIIDITSLSVQDSIQIGGAPGFITVTDDGFGYLSDWGDDQNGFLYKYNADTRSVLHDKSNPIRINKGAMDLVYSPSRSRIFIANFSEATVESIDTHSDAVDTTYVVNDGPQNLALWEE